MAQQEPIDLTQNEKNSLSAIAELERKKLFPRNDYNTSNSYSSTNPDALATGIRVNAEFKVLDPKQVPWNDLWMIVPATMGSLGDVVAASAIAKQAEQLARQFTH